MRLLYAKSNNALWTFSHCSTDVKITLFQSYCTALYCPYLWNDYKNQHLAKFVLHLIILSEKYLVYLISAVVPVVPVVPASSASSASSASKFLCKPQYLAH